MMLLGAVADDLTGATDLADALAEAGCRTEVWVGVPAPDAALDPAVDAVVVALKIRTAPVAEAVSEALAALRWLRSNGAARIVHKICSTFDSTDEGNIGPVADAFRAELGAATVAVCPAFPTNGRTVYLGHLFVGNVLLSESGMAQHPLTPMTDSSLVRVLGRQSQGDVTFVSLNTVREGVSAVAGALTGAAYAIVDAVADADLSTMASAVADQPLTVGGSALGGAIARVLNGAAATPQRRSGPTPGAAVVLSGSCSTATQAQVAAWPGARLAIDPTQVPEIANSLFKAAETVLVSTTAAADAVAASQAVLGVEGASAAAEGALAAAAMAAVAAGVTRLVVAGGETSGAVLAALGVTRLEVGPRVSPGVPWMVEPSTGRWFVLKSGNFGGPDFFAAALAAG